MGTLLGEVYDAFTDCVADLPAADLDRPTRAAEWNVRQLLFHQLLDAQRALVALASPAEEEPDVDEATYWRPFRPDHGDGGAAHARFVVRAADAWEDPRGLVDRWQETARAAAYAASVADPGARVRTQGHVLTAADLVSTLVVEATVHLLDLTLEVPGAPPPAALAHTVRVLELVKGDPLPGADADPATAVLRATGRLAADDPAYPLLG